MMDGSRSVGRHMMKIDPESWPTLSRLLDQWLDLPEESRADWLQNVGAEHADILPALRKLVLSQGSVDANRFLNTLPRMDASSAGFTVGELIGPYPLAREMGQGGM